MAEAQLVEGHWLLIVEAHLQHPLVERNGLLVLLQIEMALGVGEEIHSLLMGRIHLHVVDDRIKIFHCLLVVPLVEVAHAHVCLEAWVELVAAVQVLKLEQGLVILLALKVVQGHPQPLGIGLRPHGKGSHQE